MSQAISTHYASSYCDYINVDGTIQEILSKEVEEVARKRLGPDVKFTFQVH